MRPRVVVMILILLVAGFAGYRFKRRIDKRGTPAWPSDVPSVVLVVIDTLRADRLGLYGYDRNTSPRLDAFAASSVVFDNTFAQAPSTPGSMASMLTSLYPSSHHFMGDGDRLSESAITVAEMFRAAGYRTGGFTDGGYMNWKWGVAQGFDTYSDRKGGFAVSLPAARRFVSENRKRPFFLLVHTYDVHSPYEDTPAPYVDAFTDGTYTGDLDSELLDEIMSGEIERTITEEEGRWLSDLYDGGILHADALLGEFLDWLDTEGLLARSVVAVTSDHGEEFLEHGGVLHNKLYRTVTHVPLVLRAPGLGDGGMRVPEVVESIDIAPTLLDAAGIPAHRGMQGRSLLPLLSGEVREPDRIAVSETPWNLSNRAVVRGRHHVIVDPERDRRELYDMDADPLELNDLADRQPGRVESLVQALGDRRVEAERAGYLGGRQLSDEPLDPELVEQLRALGYIQ